MASNFTKEPLRKIVVIGGTGFLGQHICRAAALRGWQVVSISRRGTPPNADGSIRDLDSWAHKVTWAKGSAFDTQSLNPHLSGATAVVHSVGQLLEVNYKPFLSGTAGSTVCSVFRQAASSLTGCKGLGVEGIGAGNPFKRSGTSAQNSDPREKRAATDGQKEDEKDWIAKENTYEKVNRDTALAVAKASSAFRSVQRFVYISAASNPLVPARYISSKREAERHLLHDYLSFTTAALRPGFMYSDIRPFSSQLAGVMSLLRTVAPPFAGSKPLSVESVAEAAVQACQVEKVGAGIYEVEDILTLAGQT